MSSLNGEKKENVFHFDREELEQIAATETVVRGLGSYKENRVLSVDSDETHLWATVEDEEEDSYPLDAQASIGDDNQLHFSCECNGGSGEICHHLVAALLAYGDVCRENEGLLSAADTAIEERRKRAKTEVVVESESGDHWFGSWRAYSVNAQFPRNYRVVIRSLTERTNYCSCPDFASNQLGTCKHIEAVLHKLYKHPEYENLTRQAAPFPYVYLSWDHEEAPVVCVKRTGNMAEELRGFLDTYFHADGTFTARMPDDFFRFLELADQREDIHIGEDAVDWANHQVRAGAQKRRAEEIRTAIENTRGRLPSLKTRLYPYQVSGAAFLAGNGRALLADDMGLGKTIQAIAAATWLINNSGVRKVLIICPASLKQQWAREIDKFTDLDSVVISGPPDQRAVQYRQQANFCVLNYELVLRDLSIITEILGPDLIIMDEAQRIKNWRTKIAAAVKLIPSRYAFVLTGTPLENRLEDLYSLMQVVDPKILGPLWRYMVDYHVTDERDKVLGYRNLAQLRQRLQPVMLRRDRALVSDQLPDRITQQLDIAMTPKQWELHDDGLSRAGLLAQKAKRRPLTPSEQNRLIAALQQARMACDSAGLVDKETMESPKIDELCVLLEEICLQEGRKAVVFSQWERMTAMVEQRLKGMGIGCVRLHGGIPTAKRGALMDSFRDDDRVQVFISTDAGGVGLNLQSGSALINLDVPWNPAVLEQRNSRIHRLGQSRKVQIITMVAANSYERQVLGLVNNKQNLFDNVIKEDGTEDVVGVSKKLLETLMENLAVEETVSRGPLSPAEEPAAEEEVPVEAPEKKPSRKEDEEDIRIRRIIEGLQEAFGPRIERIFGAQGGLVCVLDRVDAEAEAVGVELSGTVPVALIDHYALQGLKRLGAASPVAEAVTYYEHGDPAEVSGPSRMQLLAEEKFEAARILQDQGKHHAALELLLSAMLAKGADLAGLKTPVNSTETAVWIYGEALPQGYINDREAGLLMRAVGLGQAESVPEELFISLMEDGADFVAREE